MNAINVSHMTAKDKAVTNTNILSQDRRALIHAPRRVIVLHNCTLDEIFPRIQH